MSKDSSASTLDFEARALLQRASEKLVRTGDNRGLISFVERWCATEAVPSSVLISEVRALLDFKLMDRAWVRLRELSERLPDDLEVTCLTCEMFIERGWPARAEKLLKPMVSVGGYPEAVDALFLRSQRSVNTPLSNARELERRGSASERLALAEGFIATGSHLRARSVLERVRHDAGEGVERAEDLLWGLDSGFDNESQPLLEWAREITGDGLLGGSGEIDLVELTGDLISEVTSFGEGQDLFESGDPSFPSLFRSVDTGDDEEGVAEATKVTSLARLMEEAEETMEHTAGAGLEEGWDNTIEDTRVMVVVHQSLSDGDGIESHNYSQNQGDDAPDPFDLDDSNLVITGLLEGEDADLIVLTNDESNSSQDVQQQEEFVPMRVVEPETIQKPRVADAVQSAGMQQSERQSTPATLAQGEESTVGSSPRKRYPQQTVQSSLNLRRMLQVTLVVALVCIMLVVIASRKKRTVQAAAVVAEILSALPGTESAWRGTSSAFERRVLSGFDPTRRNELGLVILDMVRWNESGNIETTLESIESRLAGLEEDLSGSPEYILALAEFSLVIGDYEGLNNHLISLEHMEWAETKHLRSATLLQANNAAAARSFAAEAVASSPSSVRYLTALGRVCSLIDDGECVESVAATLSRLAPDSYYATFMEIAGSEHPLADSRLDDVLRQAPLRISSQNLLWFARLSGESAVVDQAVDRALGLDPENRQARFLKGVRRLAQGEALGAEMDFTVCLNLMPASFDCQLGLALSQFELDHVDEAAAWITGGSGLDTEYRLNPILSGWLRVEQNEPVSSVEGLGDYRSYLRALADRDGAATLSASDELLEQGGVFNELLGARGLARAARFGVEESSAADRAYALAPLDPVVLTDLAWFWDSVGYDSKSIFMFRVALERGAESAYALVERGRFYLDLGDNFIVTRGAWLQYRDLNPTGPRSVERLSNLERLR